MTFKDEVFSNYKLETLAENMKNNLWKKKENPYTEGLLNLIGCYNTTQARGCKDLIITTLPPQSKDKDVYEEMTSILDWAKIKTFKMPSKRLSFRDIRGFEEAGWKIKSSSKVFYNLTQDYDYSLTMVRAR